MSYVLLSPDRSVWEVRSSTLTGDVDHLMLTVSRSEKNWVFLRGWLKGDQEVLVLTSVRNADGTQQVEITRAGLNGKTETLGRAEHAFGATARLDPNSQILCLTLAEDGIHNLYSFALAQPAFTRLTDNQLPGVTFSGIEFTKDGTLLYTRTERKQDIWMIQFN